MKTSFNSFWDIRSLRRKFADLQWSGYQTEDGLRRFRAPGRVKDALFWTVTYAKLLCLSLRIKPGSWMQLFLFTHCFFLCVIQDFLLFLIITNPPSPPGCWVLPVARVGFYNNHPIAGSVCSIDLNLPRLSVNNDTDCGPRVSSTKPSL